MRRLDLAARLDAAEPGVNLSIGDETSIMACPAVAIRRQLQPADVVLGNIRYWTSCWSMYSGGSPS
jgi:hypothetical protein